MRSSTPFCALPRPIRHHLLSMILPIDLYQFCLCSFTCNEMVIGVLPDLGLRNVIARGLIQKGLTMVEAQQFLQCMAMDDRLFLFGSSLISALNGNVMEWKDYDVLIQAGDHPNLFEGTDTVVSTIRIDDMDCHLLQTYWDGHRRVHSLLQRTTELDRYGPDAQRVFRTELRPESVQPQKFNWDAEGDWSVSDSLSLDLVFLTSRVSPARFLFRISCIDLCVCLWDGKGKPLIRFPRAVQTVHGSTMKRNNPGAQYAHLDKWIRKALRGECSLTITKK